MFAAYMLTEHGRLPDEIGRLEKHQKAFYIAALELYFEYKAKAEAQAAQNK